jgi:hypothetical protein
MSQQSAQKGRIAQRDRKTGTAVAIDKTRS